MSDVVKVALGVGILAAGYYAYRQLSGGGTTVVTPTSVILNQAVTKVVIGTRTDGSSFSVGSRLLHGGPR